MASIGEDDLFDEEIVKLYLKEVTFIKTYFCSCMYFRKKKRKKSKKINKTRNSARATVLGKIDIGKFWE